MMKRITFDGLFCDIAKCEDTPGGSYCENGTCSQRQVWERLKAIENILGDTYDLEHIRDLLQAEQDGRLVVLPPCTVVCGTTIWWADSNFHTDPIKCEVSSFGIYTGPDGDLQVWMNCYVYGSTPMSQSFRMSSIGKTVFLTREEAEAAMKEDTYHA